METIILTLDDGEQQVAKGVAAKSTSSTAIVKQEASISKQACKQARKRARKQARKQAIMAGKLAKKRERQSPYQQP